MSTEFFTLNNRKVGRRIGLGGHRTGFILNMEWLEGLTFKQAADVLNPLTWHEKGMLEVKDEYGKIYPITKFLDEISECEIISE